MFELNEQELEQVAGGHGHSHYGSTSAATGDAGAYIGAASSNSYASSKVTPWYAKSSAENDSSAIGLGAYADSAATTSAGAGH